MTQEEFLQQMSDPRVPTEHKQAMLQALRAQQPQKEEAKFFDPSVMAGLGTDIVLGTTLIDHLGEHDKIKNWVKPKGAKEDIRWRKNAVSALGQLLGGGLGLTGSYAYNKLTGDGGGDLPYGAVGGGTIGLAAGLLGKKPWSKAAMAAAGALVGGYLGNDVQQGKYAAPATMAAGLATIPLSIKMKWKHPALDYAVPAAGATAGGLVGYQLEPYKDPLGDNA